MQKCATNTHVCLLHYRQTPLKHPYALKKHLFKHT